MQRYDLALQEVQRALAQDPHASAPHICAASLLHDQKRLPEAEQAARAALAAEPNDADAQHILAVSLWEQSRREDVRQAFEAALALVGGRSALYLTNYARMMTSYRSYSEALTALNLADQALALAPSFADPHEIRGLALRQLGRDAEAEAAIRAALRLNPQSFSAQHNLGLHDLTLGRAHTALDRFREALRLNPESEIARTNLVLALKARNPLYGRVLSPLADRLGAPDDELFASVPDLAERSDVTFADVGGMAEVKERIRMAIIYPLQRPEVFAAYGKRAGGGLLLYGPPGCGKTYLARATAGEAGARFLSVGISDILDMWHGQSEQKLHALFESARRARPAVLFFDEIEAIGGNRLVMRQRFQRTLVNQFLAELDGADSNNDGILVIGATNAPWHVDSALRRPGRFDHVVFVACSGGLITTCSPHDATAASSLARALRD